MCAVNTLELSNYPNDKGLIANFKNTCSQLTLIS